MKKQWVCGIGLLVVSLVASPMVLATCDKDHGNKCGWFWYEEPEPEADDESQKEREPLPPLPPRTELMAMHPEDLKTLRDDYLNQAVWKPTPENVKDYYVVHDTIRRKSLAFTNVTSLVMLQNPELNVGREYPITNPGREAFTKVRREGYKSTLTQYRNKYGLIVFTKQGCEYCVIQKGVLNHFVKQHAWDIKEIDIHRNPQIAATFNVDFTPITILVERNTKNWMPVAVGSESLRTVEENAYRAIRLLRGDTSPEQFFVMEHEQGGVFDPTAPGGYQ